MISKRFPPYLISLPAVSAKVYYPLERYPSYEPSSYIVFLAILQCRILGNVCIDAHKVIEWVSRLRYSCPHLLAAGKLGFNAFVRLSFHDPPDTHFLPRINTYPRNWRWRVADISAETWKALDELSNQLTLPDQPNWMTWFLATLFTIAAYRDPVSSKPTTKRGQVQPLAFYDLAKVTMADRSCYPLYDSKISATPAIENFCHKVKTSAHTCWDDYDPSWYAAAVEYLYGKDDIEFVPLMKPDCKQCTLIHAAHTFVDEISLADSRFLSSPTVALENLLCSLVGFLRHC